LCQLSLAHLCARFASPRRITLAEHSGRHWRDGPAVLISPASCSFSLSLPPSSRDPWVPLGNRAHFAPHMGNRAGPQVFIPQRWHQRGATSGLWCYSGTGAGESHGAELAPSLLQHLAFAYRRRKGILSFLSRSPLVAAPGVLATAPLSDYVPALRTPPLRRLLSMLPGPTAAGSGRGVSDRPACRGLLAGRLRADVGVTPAYQYCVCVALLGATRTPGNLVA